MSAPQLVELKGKGAIVTGGGSGINLAFTQALFAAGCSVLIADLRLHDDAALWLKSIEGHRSSDGGTPQVIFHETDVTVWKELELLFDVYANRIGGTPFLVCPGAGLYEPSTNGFWNDLDSDNHYKLFDVNINHPIKLTRISIRKMLGNNAPGIIILVSSTGAQKASIITPLYQPSKHAISCFTRAMGPLHDLVGIRVVAVAPGPTLSPMLQAKEALKFYNPKTDRLTSTADVAEGMMAVATDLKYPPGTVLEVTGSGPQHWRQVMMLNDPGPPQTAFLSGKDQAIKDVLKVLEEDKKSGSNSK